MHVNMGDEPNTKIKSHLQVLFFHELYFVILLPIVVILPHQLIDT